jgi:hypothetical protein
LVFKELTIALSEIGYYNPSTIFHVGSRFRQVAQIGAKPVIFVNTIFKRAGVPPDATRPARQSDGQHRGSRIGAYAWAGAYRRPRVPVANEVQTISLAGAPPGTPS